MAIDIKEALSHRLYTTLSHGIYAIRNGAAKAVIFAAGLLDDDMAYRKRFLSSCGKEIYMAHLDDYFVSCAFCAHLVRSSCHDYCFTCGKGTYEECGPLLPDILSLSGCFPDKHDEDATPWMFKTPCTGFERLPFRKYFKNFASRLNSFITLVNYETVEGIFLGISRGKRPCHICASVNVDIYNQCSLKGCCSKTDPCGMIMKEISDKYRAMPNMVIMR